MADHVLRNELRRTNDWLRQLGPQIGRTFVAPQGTPNVVTQSVNLTDFLYLPGRSPEQRAYGNITFDADGNLVTQALDFITGFALKAEQVGHNYTTVYFNLDDSGANYIGRWSFPITGTSPSDNTFTATTANQVLTNKTITTGSIYVGTAAAKNTFINSNNTIQNFTISLANTFPTTSVQTPQIRLPALDATLNDPNLIDSHTIMMLHSSLAAPFTAGSIAYGNQAGTEMEMLPGGRNATLLQFNEGEVVASCTWTNGAFTITGTFNTAKTKIGMRVRGFSSSSIYVDEGTHITAVTTTTLTVDTALVGNSVGATLTTFGPIWSSAVSSVAFISTATAVAVG